MSTPTEPTDEPDADVTDLPPGDDTRDEHDPWTPLPIPESEGEHGNQ